MLIGYTRCSTSEQAEGSTIGQQMNAIRGYAMMKGVDAYHLQIYSDPGVSGTTRLGDRPGGRDMLANLQHGDTIVAAKLDRMFRSASNALFTVESLQERGVKVVLLDIGMEPVTENGMAKLFFTMLSAFAEFERGRINERTNEGRQAKRKAGGVIGHVPYGYARQGFGKQATLVPSDAEQAVIKRASFHCTGFNAWSGAHQAHKKAGDRVGYIIDRLTEEGLTDRAGSQFRRIQIERMLGRIEA